MSATAKTKRKYELKERARRQEETRRRITEATVALHRTVGPAHTRIADVARRAGVQRLTVYNHFPDEASLVQACSAHWLGSHPLPDPTPWAAIPDPATRLRTALAELYAWYEETEPMTANVRRDAATMPALAAVLEQGAARYWVPLRELLARGWGARGRSRARVEAAVAVALEFGTWRTLVRQEGLAPADAVEVAAGAVERAAGG